jgi:hypothetical protein
MSVLGAPLGGGVGALASVVTVKSGEIAGFPAASRDLTR